jgi:hypothetical protein
MGQSRPCEQSASATQFFRWCLKPKSCLFGGNHRLFKLTLGDVAFGLGNGKLASRFARFSDLGEESFALRGIP